MKTPTICDCGTERRVVHLEPDAWECGAGTYRCTTCGEDQPGCVFCARQAVVHDQGEYVCHAHAPAEAISTAPTATMSTVELMEGNRSAHRRGAHKAQPWTSCPLCRGERKAVRL